MITQAWNRGELRYIWRGPAQFAMTADGKAGEHRLTGFFFRQNRFLKATQLELNGRPAQPNSVAEVAANELELTYSFPQVAQGDGGGSGSGGQGKQDGLLFRDIALVLTYRVRPASLQATLRLTNHWQEDAELDVAWSLSADYATTDEANFDQRRQSGSVATTPLTNGVRFAYEHAELPFETLVIGSGSSWEFTDGRLHTRVRLTRQQSLTLGIEVRAVDYEDSIDAPGEAEREARVVAYERSLWQLYAPAETPLIEIAQRAALDLASLAMLEGDSDEWLTPSAGVPLYQTLWGRDALTVAWQSGIMDGGLMLQDVITRCIRLQGAVLDPDRDEQPGRIINQAKLDALSRIGAQTFRRYYGDVASPFMFVIALGYHYVRTGDRAALERSWPAARRVMDWARQYGDLDGDGYIEYLTRSPHGPTHQGWKDSENAVVYEDGTRVQPPIAPCEIQGYYYAALLFMAGLAAVQGEPGDARQWLHAAADLKERFNRDFWMNEEGYIAFGLDAEKRQIRAITSNAGQCLPTGIVSDEHIPRLVRRMFEPDMFSGWGIRTLSTLNPAYNPLDYHLGSLWAVENGSILFGLRRYGLNDRTEQLARALYELARMWPGGRTPECVGGYSRDELAHPGAYPAANIPQAWNQSVMPLLVQCLLGIVPIAPLGTLLVDPILPTWLPEIFVKQLRLGDGAVDLHFFRDEKGASQYEVTDERGSVRVIRQPWLESFSTDFWSRLGDLAEAVRTH